MLFSIICITIWLLLGYQTMRADLYFEMSEEGAEGPPHWGVLAFGPLSYILAWACIPEHQAEAHGFLWVQQKIAGIVQGRHIDRHKILLVRRK